MTDPVRVGVVGVGSMGQNHARVYRELADAELVGVADADEATAMAVATEYGTSVHDTGALLERADAVSLAVPTPLHADLVQACIDAGVHVLVEKPFVNDLDRGRELAAAAEDAGVAIQVGHVERFNPAVRTLADILPDVDVVAVSAERLGPPLDRDLQSNVVYDLMIHDIDVIHGLLDANPVSVTASGTGGGQYATATCEFDDGVVASLTASRVTQQKVRQLAITGRECRVIVDYTDQSIEIHRSTTPEYVANNGDFRHRTESVVERPMVDNGEPLKHELASFTDAVSEGSDPVVSAEDGLRAVEVATRIDGMLSGERTEVVQ